MHDGPATLAKQAVLAYQAGDGEKAVKLCREAIAGLAGHGAYADVLIVLGNLAAIVPDPGEKRRMLAQAVWLALALESSNSVLYIVALFEALPFGTPLEEPLAAAALMEARRGSEDRAEMAMKLAAVMARRKHSVKAEADGFLQGFIAGAPKVAAELLPALDEAVGESWEFDRGPVIDTVGKRLSDRNHHSH